MEDKILNELKQIRQLLSELIGTAELPASEKFSKEAIAKAAKEFRKMSIERGEWISSDNINTVIKNVPWAYPGKFIIEQFGFKNYFRHMNKLYLNKKDLIALSQELKERNINIKEYADLLADQSKFRIRVTSINLSTGAKKSLHYKIPDELRNINSKPYSPAIEQLAKNEIETLMQDYKQFDLSVFINLHQGKTYALFKYESDLERYIEPKLRTYYEDWCFRFNYANDALKRILEIKAESEI